MLLEHGADPDRRNYAGDTALIISAKNRASKTVEIFLERGANPDTKNNDGDTALHICARRNTLSTVEVLMAYHATQI